MDERRIRKASLMLVLVTLLWGMSFPWTKRWQRATEDCPGGVVVSSLTLITIRMPLAMIILALWRPGLYRRPTWAEHRAGALLGLTFFAGFLPQTIGLAYTTPALSGFFTGLCCAWAPLLGWALFRTPVARLTLLGLSVAVAGMFVLVEGGWRLGKGEWLTIAASFAFAAQILVLERFGRRFTSGHLTPAFFAGTGLLGLTGLLIAASVPGYGIYGNWMGVLLMQPERQLDLFLLALLPTVLSFHWMNAYQPLVPTSRAALIYLLEPVFSSAFSVWLGYDDVTAPLVLGGSLILFGNLLVELPGLLTRRNDV